MQNENIDEINNVLFDHSTTQDRTALTINVISINIEGWSDEKEKILEQRYRYTNCDVICVQETHRGSNQPLPHIPGLNLVTHTPSRQYGSAIFVKPSLHVVSSDCKSFEPDGNPMEILTIDIQYCTITSIYKPPRKAFKFTPTNNFYSRMSKLVLGDFNCHNELWGYKDTSKNGIDLMKWAERTELSLLHDDNLCPSFFSRRHNAGYNPDLIFASSHMVVSCTKDVGAVIPRSQHRPISVKYVVDTIQEPLNMRLR